MKNNDIEKIAIALYKSFILAGYGYYEDDLWELESVDIQWQYMDMAKRFVQTKKSYLRDMR